MARRLRRQRRHRLQCRGHERPCRLPRFPRRWHRSFRPRYLQLPFLQLLLLLLLLVAAGAALAATAVAAAVAAHQGVLRPAAGAVHTRLPQPPGELYRNAAAGHARRHAACVRDEGRGCGDG